MVAGGYSLWSFPCPVVGRRFLGEWYGLEKTHISKGKGFFLVFGMLWYASCFFWRDGEERAERDAVTGYGPRGIQPVVMMRASAGSR